VSYPPATSTLPEGRRVAVWAFRGLESDPAVLQEPVAGSYSSAEERPAPAATNTFPERSRVAVWSFRPSTIEPVLLQAPVAGS
jgi:hypothetical protein